MVMSSARWCNVASEQTLRSTLYHMPLRTVRTKLCLLRRVLDLWYNEPYLMDSCTLTADVTGRQHLRSATQRKLIVPRYRLNGFGRRRFPVASSVCCSSSSSNSCCHCSCCYCSSKTEWNLKLAVLMYRCLHGSAPLYLMDSCTLTADVTRSINQSIQDLKVA